LPVPQLVETYKGFGVYQVDDAFYSVLQREGGFDMNRIRADQYSVILSGNSLDEIKKIIDESTTSSGKSPSSEPPSSEPRSFAVPDDVLFAICKDRKDLQSAYPEVEQGNLENLKSWAIKTGWKEDSRLSALIPKGETPDYLKSNTETANQSELEKSLIPILQVVAPVIVITIGGVIGYKFYRSTKKLPSGTS
jgi:hypothetical protein